MSDSEVTATAQAMVQQGLGVYDVFHVTSALVGKADIFVTTDDRLLKRLRKIANISAVFPGEALATLENWYEN